MKRFSCGNCGHEVYFDSTVCVKCHNVLGYDPGSAVMLSAPEGSPFQGDGGRYKACGNRPLVDCNWLVPESTGDRLCTACAHNRTIPNLSDDVSVQRWKALELAKRYLFYSITRWNLPHPLKVTDDDDGLAFDFLADVTNLDGTVTNVLTGHANGLITINVAEGDDAEREKRRADLGEPYRTLVGHFRHEVGHYYWDRLVRDAGEPTLARCRALFGDDTLDYGQALQAHYERSKAGFGTDWRETHVSTYATSHAWEDFAETFAHYLHTVDALETAGAFGLRTVGYTDNETHAVDFDPYVAGTVQEIVAAWVPVTIALNAINRSMGQPDFYPFTASEKPAVQEKMAFIHDIVRKRARVAPPTIEPTPMPETLLETTAIPASGATSGASATPALTTRADAKAPPPKPEPEPEPKKRGWFGLR